MLSRRHHLTQCDKKAGENNAIFDEEASTESDVENHHDDEADHHAPSPGMRVIVHISIRDKVFSHNEDHRAGSEGEHPRLKADE